VVVAQRPSKIARGGWQDGEMYLGKVKRQLPEESSKQNLLIPQDFFPPKNLKAPWYGKTI
jgi:hypothetical protein